jgi:hypothetical protein
MTADASNCIISLLRGDWERAGWSATTFIPGIGLFIGGARQGVRYSDSIIEYADEGIRHYPGRSVPPIEKTIDMALNPDLYIQAVIEKYGINLRGSGQDIIVVYNPDLVSAGRSTQVRACLQSFGSMDV